VEEGRRELEKGGDKSWAEHVFEEMVRGEYCINMPKSPRSSPEVTVLTSDRRVGVRLVVVLKVDVTVSARRVLSFSGRRRHSSADVTSVLRRHLITAEIAENGRRRVDKRIDAPATSGPPATWRR
jgi:hypothetical protein